VTIVACLAKKLIGYVLHGHPSRIVAIAQTTPMQPSTLDPTSFDTPNQSAIFNELRKWY